MIKTNSFEQKNKKKNFNWARSQIGLIDDFESYLAIQYLSLSEFHFKKIASWILI